MDNESLADETPPSGTDRGIASAVKDLIGAVFSAARQAGSFSLSTVGDTIESPARVLAGRIVTGALDQPRPVAKEDALAAALDDRPRSPLLGGSTGAALAAKVAQRVGPLRFLARRTPLWLLVTAAPALHASVTLGAQELTLVASHLAHKSRSAGLVPDGDRVRRASVQLLLGETVNAGVEPRHAALAVAWVQRALRAALPFSSGVATRNPSAIVRAAAAVEPDSLIDASLPPNR